MKPLKPKRNAQDYALWAALPMATTSQVEGRLKTILDKSRSRRRLTRSVIIAALALTVGMVVAISTALAPPRSLKEALSGKGYPSDTPAHERANIELYRASLRKFGENDPWAGKAYYGLGMVQMTAGSYGDALLSFDRAMALPEPPYANSNIHSVALYEKINTLESAHRYSEAVSEVEALLKNKGRGMITADLWENLRERLPDLKRKRDSKANRDAEKGQFAALTADPNWTQTLANGVTVQFLGIMQFTGNVHTAWSPSGRFLSRTTYKSMDNDGAGYIGPSPTRELKLILRLHYPVGQAVMTGYEVKDSVSSGYLSGFARNGTNVITDEMAFNPDTSGCRVVQAWFLLSQKQTTLRVGVALVPPPFGTNDPVDAPKDWAEFPNITLPPIE